MLKLPDSFEEKADMQLMMHLKFDLWGLNVSSLIFSQFPKKEINSRDVWEGQNKWFFCSTKSFKLMYKPFDLI